MAHTCCHPLEELDQSKPSTQQKQAEPNRLFLSPHSIRDLGSPTPGSCVCEGFGYQIEGLADNWQGRPKAAGGAAEPRVPEIHQTNKTQVHPSGEETQTPQKKILETPRIEQSAGEASTATHTRHCVPQLWCTGRTTGQAAPNHISHSPESWCSATLSLSPVPCLRHQSRVFTWCWQKS